jgi:hypothetical protein
MNGGTIRRPPIVIATIAMNGLTASSFRLPGLAASPKSFSSEFRIPYQKM